MVFIIVKHQCRYGTQVPIRRGSQRVPAKIPILTTPAAGAPARAGNNLQVKKCAITRPQIPAARAAATVGGRLSFSTCL